MDPTWVVLAAGAALAAFGLARGRARPWWALPLQAAAALLMGAAALLAVGAAPQAAAVLVAGALVAHAGWDLHHHRAERVVARSMAEFCGVLDALLAVLVLVAAFG